jgi:hypothetical protein
MLACALILWRGWDSQFVRSLDPHLELKAERHYHLNATRFAPWNARTPGLTLFFYLCANMTSSNNVPLAGATAVEKSEPVAALNGPITLPNGFHEPTQEELERELPVVHDDQVPLGDLLSRVVQAIYAELCELAETFVLVVTQWV